MQFSLRTLQFFFVVAFYKALKRPLITLLIACVLTVLSLSQLGKLRASFEFDGFIDPSSSAVRNEQDLNRLFKQKRPLVVVVERIDRAALGRADLCLLDQWIRSEKRNNPNVETVTSPFDLRKASWSGKELWYFRWVPDPCESMQSSVPVLGDAPLKKLNSSPWANVFTDKNGHDFLFEVTFRQIGAPEGEVSHPRLMVDFVKRLETLKQSGLRWHLSGRAGFQWYQWNAVKNDTLLINFAILALIFSCVRIFLGCWRGAVILIASLVLMAVWLFGCMAAAGHHVDFIANSLFSIVAIAVLEDFFFLAYRRVIAPQESWTISFSKIIFPCFATSLTTIVGFGSLYFSDLLSIQHLGLWAATGAFFEWVILFLVLPSFLKVFPFFQSIARREKVVVLEFLQSLVRRFLPKWFVILCLLIVPLGLFGIQYLQVSDNYREIFPKNHPMQKSFDYLEQTRGWVGDASLVFSAKTSQTEAEDVLRAVRKLPSVVQVQSPWEILDDMSAGVPKEIGELVRSDFRSSVFDKRFFSQSGEALVPVYMRSADLDAYRTLRSLIEERCPKRQCFLAGPMTTYEEISGKIVPTLLESCGVSLGIVSVILVFLCWSLGRLRHSWAVIVSSTWCSFAMIAILATGGFRLNYLTCMFASMLVGIAGDNAILYLMSSSQKKLGEGVVSLGPASIFISFTTIAAASAMFLSSFEPPRNLAFLFITGLAMNLFGDLWLLKSLLPRE
jgi:predicted RND superfamily exporter protein